VEVGRHQVPAEEPLSVLPLKNQPIEKYILLYEPPRVQIVINQIRTQGFTQRCAEFCGFISKTRIGVAKPRCESRERFESIGRQTKELLRKRLNKHDVELETKYRKSDQPPISTCRSTKGEDVAPLIPSLDMVK